MKLLIILNPKRPIPAVTLRAVKKFASSTHTIVMPHKEKVLCHYDMAMVFGGDGTVLYAAHLLKGTGIPIMGVNTGHRGFLTTVSANDLPKELELIGRGKYVVEDRIAVKVETPTRAGWGLNDIILDALPGRMVNIDVRLNGKSVTQYKADGLVIATPTGSTAYNLSLGGPIVDPTEACLIITPKAPISVISRSVVVSANKTLTLKLLEDSSPIRLAPDSVKLTVVAPGVTLHVHRSPTSVPIVFLPEHNSFTTMAERLAWNRTDGHLTA